MTSPWDPRSGIRGDVSRRPACKGMKATPSTLGRPRARVTGSSAAKSPGRVVTARAGRYVTDPVSRARQQLLLWWCVIRRHLSLLEPVRPPLIHRQALA